MRVGPLLGGSLFLIASCAARPSTTADASPLEEPVRVQSEDEYQLAASVRSAYRPPVLTDSSPLYAAFVFGKAARLVSWAVLERSGRNGDVYDLLHFDLDGNGGWDESELLNATQIESSEEVLVDALGPHRFRLTSARFVIGDVREPDGTTDSDFSITWSPFGAGYQIKMTGVVEAFGGVGSTPQTEFGMFARSRDEAPILVLSSGDVGFQRWGNEKLCRGRANRFQVAVGSLGIGRRSFTRFRTEVLASGSELEMTLTYRTATEDAVSWIARLGNRC